MFGLKLFNKTKTKKFENDKERRQYFAIQGYYKKNGKMNKKTTRTNSKGK